MIIIVMHTADIIGALLVFSLIVYPQQKCSFI